MCESDAQYHQTWYYTQEGMELDIIGKEKAVQEVDIITIKEPCTFKTKRHIGIGSDYDQVKKAYKKAIAWDFSNSKSIVAGSMYGGMIFNFENRKVSEIFIGAATE